MTLVYSMEASLFCNSAIAAVQLCFIIFSSFFSVPQEGCASCLWPLLYSLLSAVSRTEYHEM